MDFLGAFVMYILPDLDVLKTTLPILPRMLRIMGSSSMVAMLPSSFVARMFRMVRDWQIRKAVAGKSRFDRTAQPQQRRPSRFDLLGEPRAAVHHQGPQQQDRALHVFFLQGQARPRPVRHQLPHQSLQAQWLLPPVLLE